MIIPSIDLMGGKAVKLVNGDPKKKEFEEDALALALKFSIYPMVNVIDLDSAFGNGDNIDLVEKICSICRCNVGGGIRTIEKAYSLLKAGANKVIIGTKAEKEFLDRLPKEKVIVAIDSKKGKVVDNGWAKSSEKSPLEKIKELDGYCSGFLYTFVDNEGTMAGIDLATARRLKDATDKKIMYAGGVSSKGQVKALGRLGIDTVIGMAYYSRRLDLLEVFCGLLDFKKAGGLMPTIVQDENSQVLMLAYSTADSLREALEKRKGIYYSRSRKKIWVKGETSGNAQELLRVDVDCDSDSLLFTVRQKNFACHKGDYSCFGNRNFSLAGLIQIVSSRRGKGTFTDDMLNNEKMLISKIAEESDEIINFTDRNNLRWEIADLLYFLSILMIKNNLSFRDIEQELAARDDMNSLRLSNKEIFTTQKI